MAVQHEHPRKSYQAYYPTHASSPLVKSRYNDILLVVQEGNRSNMLLKKDAFN